MYTNEKKSQGKTYTLPLNDKALDRPISNFMTQMNTIEQGNTTTYDFTSTQIPSIFQQCSLHI